MSDYKWYQTIIRWASSPINHKRRLSFSEAAQEPKKEEDETVGGCAGNGADYQPIVYRRAWRIRLCSGFK